MLTLISAILLLLICFVLLGVKVLFVKGSRFPSEHGAHSAALRRKGVGCASGLHDTEVRRRQHHH